MPEGQDSFEVKLFDEKDGDGNMLADGSKTVDVGSPPDQIEITLDGLVHFIKLSLPANQGPPPCGVNSYALPLTVIAEDADGNEITKPGKYYNPITFTDTDKFGEISFSRKRLTAPGQKVELEYTGGPMNGAAMISAEAKGVHKSDVTPVTFDPKNDWPLANGIVEHWNDQNGNELPFYEEIKSNVKMQRSIAPKIFQMPVVKGPLCEDAYHVSGSGSVAEFYFATRKEGDRYALDFIANGDRAANQFAVQGIFTIDYLPQKAGEHRRFPYPNYQSIAMIPSPSGDYWTVETYRDPERCDQGYTYNNKRYGQPICEKVPFSVSFSSHAITQLPSSCVVGPGIPTEAYPQDTRDESAVGIIYPNSRYIAPDFGVVCIVNTGTNQAYAVRDVSIESDGKYLRVQR